MSETNTLVGCSAQRTRPTRFEHRPAHVILEVAGRRVLACTGGPCTEVRTVAFDSVLSELRCQLCKNFWRRLTKVACL